MRELKNRGLLQGNIIDYACGYGDDVKSLKEQGFDIVGYDYFNDKFNCISALAGKKYDVLTCNYMFNVIESPDNHLAMQKIIEELADNVYVAVRSDVKAIKPTWMYDAKYDGYWTPRKTFQRFYNEEKIERLFGKVEYIINDSSMKLFKIKGVG